jgi:hypothetical protein
MAPGHNFFLYHQPARRHEAMNIDGPYDRSGDAHNAIHAWCAAHHRNIAHASWEIYGDCNHDPALLETSVKCLLA